MVSDEFTEQQTDAENYAIATDAGIEVAASRRTMAYLRRRPGLRRYIALLAQTEWEAKPRATESETPWLDFFKWFIEEYFMIILELLIGSGIPIPK